MARSNKYNKLWCITMDSSKKDTIKYVRDVLDKMNIIYAECSAEMNTMIFYTICTQHRFMSICENLGSVKICSDGCDVTDIPDNAEVTNED